MGKKYTCAACGSNCESNDNWTDEDAIAEFHRLYPGMKYDPEAMVVVCDDCHDKIEEIRRRIQPGSILQ